MIRKYASLESAQILDLKGSKKRAKTASLEKIAEFEDYRTEDGYLYARIRAISSRVNKNHDGWPSVELAGGDEIFRQHQSSEGGFTVSANKNDRYGFSTFLGKPVFVDHNNSNPDRARGVIVDAQLHVEEHRTAAHDPYYSSDDVDNEHLPPTWVELLLEVDAKSFPKLAQAIIDGANDSKRGIDGFSMGCDVEKSVCNICKNAAVSPDEFCNHVKLKGAHFDWINPKTGRKMSKRSYENCYGIKFFEISAVFDPADETALTREVVAAVHKEAIENAPRTSSWNQRLGSTRVAEHPLPQSEMMTAPEYVDTMREEEVCPVCGSNMEEGHQCEVCGYVQPPDGLDNPDLDAAKDLNQLAAPQDTPQMDNVHPEAVEGPPTPPPTQVGNPAPNNLAPIASVTNDMAWQIYHPKLAGKINSIERPLQPGTRPATNEPNEQVISDQDRPVTNRTAASMIAAVTKENNMSNGRTAADAPTADTRADKRVDVEGVGGVMDASNEQASKPEDKHGESGTGVTVDVTGKGGILQDSNQEASKADRQESLPTAGKDSDDSGYNKDKNIEGTKTQTFPNSNEPNSAVTQKAFPTAAQKQAWGDERAFPTEGGIDQGSASKGAQPADPVGKADDRIDVTQPVTVNNPQNGTDQWTGTDGNGVTRQQDPVTRVVDPNIDVKKSSIVELFKIADAEVELGLIEAEEKYDRIAELEKATPDEIRATAHVLARVKTAGLRKNASVKQGGVGRVPSFRSPRTASVAEADESIFL